MSSIGPAGSPVGLLLWRSLQGLGLHGWSFGCLLLGLCCPDLIGVRVGAERCPDGWPSLKECRGPRANPRAHQAGAEISRGGRFLDWAWFGVMMCACIRPPVVLHSPGVVVAINLACNGGIRSPRLV